jgi:ATP-dependent Clp protease ATP-binding subunit ClpC
MTTGSGTQDRFTPTTRDTIERARQSVLKYKHTHITPEHILLGLLTITDPVLLKGVALGKAKPDQIRILVEHHLRIGETVVPEDQLGFSERAKRVIEAAKEESVRGQQQQIAPEHLLLGLIQVRNTVASAVLAAIDLNVDLVREAVKK